MLSLANVFIFAIAFAASPSPKPLISKQRDVTHASNCNFWSTGGHQEPEKCEVPSTGTLKTADKGKVDIKNSAPVFEALNYQGKDSSTPLGGSYEAGEKIFLTSQGATEAEAIFNSIGPRLIIFCGYACTPMGLNGTDLEIAEAACERPGLQMPATTDAHSKKNGKYVEEAAKFTVEFNRKMLALMKAKQKTGASK